MKMLILPFSGRTGIMLKKVDIEALKQRVLDLEGELARYRADAASGARVRPASGYSINVSGIEVSWDIGRGRCTFENLPVAMMWMDTTLLGLLSGVQAMVGTERFALALQSEGRKSVAADWQVISQFPDFSDGFKAIANVAAVAGWGRWELVRLDESERRCVFRVHDSWEGQFQRTLKVKWGSNMLAGKLAGYAGRLFGTNCWAEQTHSIAGGDDFDEFVVKPSQKSVEQEIENLLSTDQGTRADMAVALMKLKQEIKERRKVEKELRAVQSELERRVLERTDALADVNEQLKVSEQRFRSIFESSPMGIYIYELDENDQLIFRGANPSADSIIGVDHTRFMGKTLEEAFPPLESTEIPGKYREVCITGKPWHTEHVQYDDGEISGCFEVYTFKTGHRKIAVLFLDITERVLSEREKEGLVAKLHRSKKMEALGMLAGGVAHDLNNILTGIVGYPELMAAMLPEDSPLRRPLSMMEKSGLQAAAVVQDLLTIARGAASTREVIAPGGSQCRPMYFR
ncbi:MAG: PAS domain-containing protein [Deltaproteobacteria bacterium]|nr:PAS domain-containing protein [Deltaproteobacteria bacterium]